MTTSVATVPIDASPAAIATRATSTVDTPAADTGAYPSKRRPTAVGTLTTARETAADTATRTAFGTLTTATATSASASTHTAADRTGAANPSADSTSAGLLGSLREVLAEVMSIKRELVRDLDTEIPGAALAVLSSLARCEPSRASHLAEVLQLDLSVVSRHLSALETQGLVQRTPFAQDRRVHELILTPEGRAALDRIVGTVGDRLGRSVDGWPADDLSALQTLLARLVTDLRRTRDRA